MAAANLSKRYITQRFLPDKAIDLMDEACANLRVQLDSKPEVRTPPPPSSPIPPPPPTYTHTHHPARPAAFDQLD